VSQLAMQRLQRIRTLEALIAQQERDILLWQERMAKAERLKAHWLKRANELRRQRDAAQAKHAFIEKETTEHE